MANYVQTTAPTARLGLIWTDTSLTPPVEKVCTGVGPDVWTEIPAASGVVVRGNLLIGNSTPVWVRLAVGAAGRVLWSDGTDPSWQVIPQIIVLGSSEKGVNLAVTTGTHRFYMRGPGTRVWRIDGVWISAGVAPTGAAILVDVNINGTTIFTTQANRPSIAISGFVSSRVTNMDVTTISEGQYFTADVDQVGSTVTGQDLLVFVELAVTTA